MKSVLFDDEKITPSKIVCVGRNYVEHIKELNNEFPKQLVIFIKPNSAISSNIFAGKTDEIHYEGEITFLMFSGKIAAVGLGLDLTKREIQSQLKSNGLPWERAKAFDNSAVFSKFVSFSGDVSNLRIELFKNGKLVQKGDCELMIYKPSEIINEISSFLSLEDGDLIMTGTPSGVGKVARDDKFVEKLYDNETLLIEKSWLVI